MVTPSLPQDKKKLNGVGTVDSRPSTNKDGGLKQLCITLHVLLNQGIALQNNNKIPTKLNTPFFCKNMHLKVSLTFFYKPKKCHQLMEILQLMTNKRIVELEVCFMNEVLKLHWLDKDA